MSSSPRRTLIVIVSVTCQLLFGYKKKPEGFFSLSTLNPSEEFVAVSMTYLYVGDPHPVNRFFQIFRKELIPLWISLLIIILCSKINMADGGVPTCRRAGAYDPPVAFPQPLCAFADRSLEPEPAYAREASVRTGYPQPHGPN